MNFTGYELLWLFFAYSFLGWTLETVIAATKQKRFVNRGVVNGPFCIIYGIAAIVMTIGLHELNGIWLFIGAMIDATLIEWIAGHLIEKIYHERWWNYSSSKWNLDGYICLSASALWGVLGFVIIQWGNSFLTWLFHLCPKIPGQIIVWIFIVILIIDVLADYLLITKKSGRLDRWEAANSQITNLSLRLGTWIAEQVERRIRKAYPQAVKAHALEEKTGAFAEGCGFYKIVMLFFIGAFLGDIIETIFCRLTTGIWMSRSSVVWGPFSIVWGLALAAVTATLFKYRNYGDRFLFLIGTLLGGAYEYFCSVFTEMVFGKIFWDYSHMPFNLGGRINLLFCFFWGFATVIWFKHLYPRIEVFLEKLPVFTGRIFTWILILFMSCNICVTCFALIRYDQRSKSIAPESTWQQWMDKNYNDHRMERIYPNAKNSA